MAIYTKKGDEGLTQVKNKKVSKSSLVVSALGELDELNVLIGSCATCLNTKDFTNEESFLILLQKNVFTISSHIVGYDVFTNKQIQELTTKLENNIDSLMLNIKPLNNFVLAGGSLEIINTNLARVKARKVERLLVLLFETEPDFKSSCSFVLPFFNRLSDYFFALSLYVAEKQGIELEKWFLN